MIQRWRVLLPLFLHVQKFQFGKKTCCCLGNLAPGNKSQLVNGNHGIMESAEGKVFTCFRVISSRVEPEGG